MLWEISEISPESRAGKENPFLPIPAQWLSCATSIQEPVEPFGHLVTPLGGEGRWCQVFILSPTARGVGQAGQGGGGAQDILTCSAAQGKERGGHLLLDTIAVDRVSRRLLLRLFDTFQRKFVCLYLCQTLTVRAEFFHAHSASG